MSDAGRPGGQRHISPTAISIAIGVLVLAALIFVPWLARPAASAAAAPSTSAEPATSAAPVPPSPSSRSPKNVWTNEVKVDIAMRQPIERMPGDGPYVLRVTELEMEPGARIFEHHQIGVGIHLVADGSIKIDDLDHKTSTTWQKGQSYVEAQEPLHQATNPGPAANRVLMFDILTASRGFDGQQEFTSEGRHNEGEVRSGPYVQMPLRDLPRGPLMLRLTRMQFAGKAKTEVHTRIGPAIFYVEEGTATVRKDWNNSSATYGTNGYFYESGKEPFILENKPARPARFIALEVLPASVGDGPSTVPLDTP